MQRYARIIKQKIQEGHLETKVAFWANGDELHCHDLRYGPPFTTLKREAEGFILESRRDLERGGTYHNAYADETEAVNAFVELLLADYRYGIQKED